MLGARNSDGLVVFDCSGRLKHGRHFTFKSVLNEAAITLVSSSVVGSIATEQSPFAAHGPWLQVDIEIHHLQCYFIFF